MPDGAAPVGAAPHPGGCAAAPAAARGSPKPLRVLFCLSGDENRASSRVRGYWIAEELAKMGVVCWVRSLVRDIDRLRCAPLLPHCDIVVFQKRTRTSDRLLRRFATALGCRTYYDFDDAPHGRNVVRAETMMRAVDGVLGGSVMLVQMAQRFNSNAHLVPTSIRLSDYGPRVSTPAQDRVCLGWIGNGAVYAEDLVRILRPPVAALAARLPLRLKIVGACGERRLYEAFTSIAGLEAELVDQIEWSRPGAASEAMADVDVGLYPLIDSDFNRFKCGFKALEYMAMGLPVLASDIVSNANIVSDEIEGLLADGEQAWISGLERLCTDGALRDRLGRAGRRKVEREFTTEQVARRMLAIFQADLVNRGLPAA